MVPGACDEHRGPNSRPVLNVSRNQPPEQEQWAQVGGGLRDLEKPGRAWSGTHLGVRTRSVPPPLAGRGHARGLSFYCHVPPMWLSTIGVEVGPRLISRVYTGLVGCREDKRFTTRDGESKALCQPPAPASTLPAAPPAHRRFSISDSKAARPPPCLQGARSQPPADA